MGLLSVSAVIHTQQASVARPFTRLTVADRALKAAVMTFQATATDILTPSSRETLKTDTSPTKGRQITFGGKGIT